MSTAWLFPGQGSQSVGMGKDVHDGSEAARSVWERANEALGEDLRALAFEGPEDRLMLTANAQPAIVAMSFAMLAALQERIPDLPAPAWGAGHSVGEYSALVAAGGVTFEDAIRLVRARGKAMQEAVAPGVGAMAAVMGLDAETVGRICEDASGDEIVRPANFNAPKQVVIAGHAGAVLRAGELVEKAMGRVIRLKVSAPFHCPLMQPAAQTVERELGRIEIKPLAFPVIANVDARPNAEPLLVKQLLVLQVDGPVHWEESVRFLHEQQVTHCLEIGPGKVLAGLARRTVKQLRVLSVNSLAGIDSIASFLALAPSTGSSFPPPTGRTMPPPTE